MHCPVCGQSIEAPLLGTEGVKSTAEVPPAEVAAAQPPEMESKPAPKKKSAKPDYRVKGTGGGGEFKFFFIVIVLLLAAYGYGMYHYNESPQQFWQQIVDFVQKLSAPVTPPPAPKPTSLPEKQGDAPGNPTVRDDRAEDELAKLKERISNRIDSFLRSEKPLTQIQMQLIGNSYNVKQSPVCHTGSSKWKSPPAQPMPAT